MTARLTASTALIRQIFTGTSSTIRSQGDRNMQKTKIIAFISVLLIAQALLLNAEKMDDAEKTAIEKESAREWTVMRASMENELKSYISKYEKLSAEYNRRVKGNGGIKIRETAQVQKAKRTLRYLEENR